MKTSLLITTIALTLLSAVGVHAGDPPQHHIDTLLNKYYSEQGVEPTDLISDETYVRRAYLDIAGRIPTYAETVTFLGDDQPYKREALVDSLLDSEAYVSNMFNWWADLLRTKSRLSNQIPGGPDYIEWIKDSVRDNLPFDQMVYALITAEGYPRDNPAVGYYLRDNGMPLDNMSNTAQLFLGTQLQCAQCHDHPFDTWTQKQFYELAAHTYGVQTRLRVQDNPMFKEVSDHIRQERVAAFRNRNSMSGGAQPDRARFRAFQEIFSPFNYGAVETSRPLTLPKDYQYDNAAPNERVAPSVIFGESHAHGTSSREAYANWMIDPENPRFTKVIANRMWAEVTGRGLFEPVDDLTAHTQVTNPELLDTLSDLMIDLDYDLKEFQRVLYKTQLYQREKNTQDISTEETWHFTGPTMERMSAEQIWDSMMTLIVRDIDTKKGPEVAQRYGDQAQRADALKTKSPEEIMEMADQLATLEKENVARQSEMRQKQTELSSATDRRRFGMEAAKYQRERRAKTNAILGVEPAGEYSMMMGGGNNNNSMAGRRSQVERRLVRASEQPSPAPPGTFLRQFGQSDREVIENANTEASIPQVLALMNGEYGQNMLNERGLLLQTIKEGETPTEKIDRLFVSILSRKPDPQEKKLVLEQLKERGRMGMVDIAWALLNTQQFIFIP